MERLKLQYSNSHDEKDLKKIIESIIFVSDKPVTLHELKSYFKNTETKIIKNLLKDIYSDWNNLDRGFIMTEISGGFQFRTKSEYSEHIINFNKEIKKFRLSNAALEVLAITAYNQPLTKLEIDKIRGVDSSGVINSLLEKRLLEIRGRKEVIGRPFIYGTTDLFLETFSLKSIRDLPSLKELETIDNDLNINI